MTLVHDLRLTFHDYTSISDLILSHKPPGSQRTVFSGLCVLVANIYSCIWICPIPNLPAGRQVPNSQFHFHPPLNTDTQPAAAICNK